MDDGLVLCSTDTPESSYCSACTKLLGLQQNADALTRVFRVLGGERRLAMCVLTRTKEIRLDLPNFRSVFLNIQLHFAIG